MNSVIFAVPIILLSFSSCNAWLSSETRLKRETGEADVSEEVPETLNVTDAISGRAGFIPMEKPRNEMRKNLQSSTLEKTGPAIFITPKDPDVTPKPTGLRNRNDISFGPHAYKDDRVKARGQFDGVKPIYERPEEKPEKVKWWLKNSAGSQNRRPNSESRRGPERQGKPQDNRPQTTPAASPVGSSTSRNRTASPAAKAFAACRKRCNLTVDLNPICGSDGVQYDNISQLKCAQNCGKRVQPGHPGRCHRRN